MNQSTQKTALVIEDNEDNMVLITMLLQNVGYNYLWAPTGLQGVQMVSKHNPDFVILDIQLPDIIGDEVLTRIRALNGSISSIPVIAMTSYAMAGDREKLLASGCDGYIEKPIDPTRVIKQIADILDQTT